MRKGRGGEVSLPEKTNRNLLDFEGGKINLKGRRRGDFIRAAITSLFKRRCVLSVNLNLNQFGTLLGERGGRENKLDN